MLAEFRVSHVVAKPTGPQCPICRSILPSVQGLTVQLIDQAIHKIRENPSLYVCPMLLHHTESSWIN